ncbi:MAG: hypothetical protein ACXIUW_01215 [Roseinatronobacter sp.]
MVAFATPLQTDLLRDVLQLQSGRAHEFCGPARRVLAAWMMASLPAAAPVIWIRTRARAEHLYPPGLRNWASPEGLITLTPRREAEALACAEEALRSGAVALVVVELTAPPALTPTRRLHLAAETGLARRRVHTKDGPLFGIILTPETGGAPGVESRWHMSPRPSPQTPMNVAPAWRLERLRARMAPNACWHVNEQLQAWREA